MIYRAALWMRIWQSGRSPAQIVRYISGFPKTPALSMHADPEEVSERCCDFLRLCREHGGAGTVDLTISDTVAEVKLNNWSKRNALSGTMVVELERIISRLEQWPEGKAVILHGENDVFCSGGDVHADEKIDTPELGVQMSYFMQHTLHRLCSLPMLVTAMVSGGAYGGGAELTTACDFRLYSPNAEVRFLHSAIGITTVFGGASRLARIVGPSNALHYLISGETITAERAKAIGFCNFVCSQNSGGLDVARSWLAENYLSKSVQVIRAYKQAIQRMHSSTLMEAYQHEMDATRSTWASPAHRKALAKAVGKTPVEYKMAVL